MRQQQYRKLGSRLEAQFNVAPQLRPGARAGGQVCQQAVEGEGGPERLKPHNGLLKTSSQKGPISVLQAISPLYLISSPHHLLLTSSPIAVLQASVGSGMGAARRVEILSKTVAISPTNHRHWVLQACLASCPPRVGV